MRGRGGEWREILRTNGGEEERKKADIIRINEDRNRKKDGEWIV